MAKEQPEVRNKLTVSVTVKVPTVQYGSIEVMACYTQALPDSASMGDAEFAEAACFEALKDAVELQAATLRQSQLEAPPPMPPVAPEQPAPLVPTTAKPVNPPAAKATATQGWTKVRFAPKADERVTGQYWATKVLAYVKGEFVGKSNKPFNAVKLTLDNGKFGTKDTYVFHNHPAYPADGTAWRDFFVESSEAVDIADKGVYVVLGVTGVECEGKLDVIAGIHQQAGRYASLTVAVGRN